MNALPFRIKIGVTGHRDNLPDRTLLISQISDVLGIDAWISNKEIHKQSVLSLFDPEAILQLKRAKNTPIAFSVLTSLAEGADRIVADAILKIEDSKIEVVLPLTLEDYIKDFATSQSVEEFDRLLKLDYSPLYLRSNHLEDQYTLGEIPDRRRQAYLNAGKYIVDHCDVLIAIWNGIEAPGKGGTYDVIQYARESKRPVIVIRSIDDNEVHIEKGNGISARAISQIDHFNSFNVSENIISKYTSNVFEEYFNSPDNPGINIFSDESLLAVKNHLIPYYAKASLLAKSYKKGFIWTGQFAYFLSALAVMILLISIIFHVFTREAFVVEFILLLLIFTLITVAHKRKTHTRWLEYRFLVERIRVAPYFFLVQKEISGITASSNSQLPHPRGQWAIMVMAEIWSQLNSSNQKQAHHQKTADPLNRGIISYVQKSWVEGQIAFQKKYLNRNKRINNFLEMGGRVIFAMAIASALTHIILFSEPDASGGSNLMHHLLTLLALALPSIAASLEGVRRQGEYSRNKNRSEAMILALDKMRQKYILTKEKDEFYRLLHETDKLMMSETEEWMMLLIPSELDYVT